MELEHGITCECGQTFLNPEKLKEHVAVEKVLDEIKRIGGQKFYKVTKGWEDDAHSGDLKEFAHHQDIELTPENATEIAQAEICHIVRHHDEYALQNQEVEN